MEFLHHLSRGIGYTAIAIIVYGVIASLVRFIASDFKLYLRQPVSALRDELREQLGYYLLLGLEFTIASDIIDTILSLERDALLDLGLVVAIRTAISFSLNWELAQHAKRSGS